MRVLIIDEEAKTEIKKVIDYAEQHKLIADLTRVIIDDSNAVGNDTNSVCYLVDGFRIAYSIEEQPCGWCRHISISVSPKDGKQLLPSIPAVEMIMREFGLVGTIYDCENVSIEEDICTIEGATQAINIVQLLNKEL